MRDHRFLELAGALLGCVAFALVLRSDADWSRVPDPAAAGWLLAIALLVLEAVAARRSREVVARAAGRALLLFCVFLVPALLVARVWSEGKGGYYLVGGLVPWSDASNQYQGAVEVKDQAKLDYWNQRRPLNAAVNSIKLRFGGDLKGWVALAAFLFAVALALAARETALLFGTPAAAVLATVVCRYAAEHLGTTMSENNGVLFGLLATATLLAAIRLRSVWWFLGGLFLLALALDVRPGAMFVLPLLCLWGAMVFGDGLGKRLRIFGVAILVTILGFAPSRIYGALWGDGSSAAHSNLAMTLYGLAAGNKGWYQSYIDYPLERFPDERAQTQALNARSLELIRAYPWRFAKSLAHNTGHFLAHLDEFLKVGVVLSALVLLVCVFRLRDPRASLLGVVFLAVVFSAAFLVRDAAGRIFGTTIPLTALIPAMALTLLSGKKVVEEPTARAVTPIVAMALAGLLITAPVIAAGHNAPPSLPPTPPGRITVFIPGASGEWIDVVSDRDRDRSRVPIVRQSDLMADLSLTELKEDRFERRKAPFSFGLAIDARGRNWFVTPTAVLLPRTKRPLLLAGEEHAVDRDVYYLSVKEVYVLSPDGRSWTPLVR